MINRIKVWTLAFVGMTMPALPSHAAVLNVPAQYSTIQACADAAQPGDTCLIAAGSYNEWVDTRRGGVVGQPITFETQANATTIGFNVRGGYTTIKGFTLTGNHPSSVPHVYAPGNNVIITGNTIHTPNPARANGAIWVSGANSLVEGNDIHHWTDGTAITVMGENNVVERNVIRDSTDIDAFRVFGRGHTIRQNIVRNITDGPKANHIDFIQTFGNNGEYAYDITIESNFVMGLFGQIAQLTPSCGIDSSGSNGMANFCGDRPEVNGTATALAVNTITDTSKNWITGVWGADHWKNFAVMFVSGNALGKVYIVKANSSNVLTVGNPDGSNADLAADGVAVGDAYEIRNRIGWWTFKNNVFFNTNPDAPLQMSGSIPSLHMLNNTFIGARAVFSGGSLDRGRAANGRVIGNVHVGTGEFYGLADSVSKATFFADYNFKSGPAPTFAKKDDRCSEEYAPFRFCEESWPGKHGVNGRDPLFKNINNPFGADGILFTLDDGLKPNLGSPLCGAGSGGTDIGVYSCNPNILFSNGAPPPPGWRPPTGGTGEDGNNGPDDGETGNGTTSPAPLAWATFKTVFNPTREPLVVNFTGGNNPTLFIYDRFGHEVRQLSSSANGQILWDGRNDSGDMVGSGVYVIVLNAAGGNQKRKIVVVK